MWDLIRVTLDIIDRDFTLLAQKKDLKLSVRRCNLTVNTDPLWLTRILQNLVSNAIRYTEQGKILIACRKRGDKLKLQIWDTGLGIEENQQESVFLEFNQLHNSQRNRNQGLGLGLAIVKRLCHLLDHPLNLHSIKGKGSVFSLTLPLVNSSTLNLQLTPDDCVTQIGINKRILVIDDEVSVLEAMETLLKRWGYSVLIANSYEHAMSLIKDGNSGGLSYRPDMILSDYRLPNMQTGIDLIKALHTFYDSFIPSIVITGDTTLDENKRINQSDILVLRKPVKPAQLRLVLNSTFINHDENSPISTAS